jgi:hypothetical protein
MRTITLTPEEYITFCLIMQQDAYKNVKINTTFKKNSVMITALDGFLAELGY